MYEFLREMLSLADIVKDSAGSIETVDMGVFLPGQDRIRISGVSGDGKPFELTLEVGKWEKSE